MKTFTFDTSHLPGLQQDLHKIMMKNELANGKGAYTISHAIKGQSGYSFGPAQWDLAKNAEARADFQEILGNYAKNNPKELSQATLAEISKEIAIENSKGAAVEANKAVIEKALSPHSRKIWR